MAPVSFSCTMLVSSCIVKCLAARCRLVHCKRGGCWRTVFLNRFWPIQESTNFRIR